MIELVSSAAEKAVPTAPLLELGGDGWTLGEGMGRISCGWVMKFDRGTFLTIYIYIYIYIYIHIFVGSVGFPGPPQIWEVR